MHLDFLSWNSWRHLYRHSEYLYSYASWEGLVKRDLTIIFIFYKYVTNLKCKISRIIIQEQSTCWHDFTTISVMWTPTRVKTPRDSYSHADNLCRSHSWTHRFSSTLITTKSNSDLGRNTTLCILTHVLYHNLDPV